MAILILLYVLASNGFVVAGWCWGLAWAGFGLSLFFSFVKALAEMIEKYS